MPAPELGPASAAAYARLSEVRRAADAGLDYPLARYLQAMLADVDVIPLAPDELPARGGWWSQRDRARWFGVLVGARYDPMATTVELYDRVFHRALEISEVGTLEALRKVLEPMLTGTQTLQLARHYHGNPWLVRVSTIPSETPQGPGTWGELMAAAPTWADLMVGGTWSGLGVLQLIGAATLEKEAGVRLVYVPLNEDGTGGEDDLPPVISYRRFYAGVDYAWDFADTEPSAGDLAVLVTYDDIAAPAGWSGLVSPGRVFARLLGADPAAEASSADADGRVRLVVRGYSDLDAVDTADDVADPADPLELDAGTYSPADPDQPGLALVIGIKADGAEIMEPVPAPFTTVLPDGIAEPVAWLPLVDGDPAAVDWYAGTIGDLTPEQRAVLILLE